MFKSVFLIALALVAVHLNAQTTSAINRDTSLSEKIDTYLLSATKAHKFNGVALIEQNGKTILHKAFGWKDFAAKTLNDTLTKFPILSVTKSFTATVLLKLQEQGLLSINDPLGKYFPDYPEGGKITLEQLITHSSGIYNYTDNIDEADSAVVCHPVSKAFVVEQFKNKPLAFQPGKGFSYNNSGYYLAGLVIEKVTGKPYEQNVRELIFEPLGMANSGFDYLNLPTQDKAVGYQFLNDKVQKRYPLYDSTVGYAAGSIYSTTGDMLKWAHAIAGGKLLLTNSWKEALTPKNNAYGYGFQMGSYQDRPFVRHAGGYPGFVSEYLYYPKEGLTILLLTNSGNYGEELWPIASDVSKLVFGLPYELWHALSPVTLTEDLLKEKEGSYAFRRKQLRFFVKEGQLYLTNTQGREIPLFAVKEDFFYTELFYTEFQFVKDNAGNVVKVITHERGVAEDYEWKKENK
jgi:CubicO group peptidase (beta-lactamase class C family)